jgi:predicted short-subunit dehydrogenase-like oxidoreductase (DUF2520 family)
MSSLSKESKIGFVGAGMVGKSLALALSRAGYPVVAASSRTHASAEALASLVRGCEALRTHHEVAAGTDIVIISSPDDAIGPVASDIAWRTGQAAVHCSGAASLDVLEPARRLGGLPGAFHPLQTFSTVESAVQSLPQSTIAIEGEGDIRAYLEEMALALGCNPIFLRPEDKPLYHASVVMMGGLLTGLAGAVAELWGNFGIDRRDALQSLVPMIQGNANTLRSAGMPQSIAGPYVRGDVGTIRKHLDAIGSTSPHMLPAYCHMALVGLPFAFEKGKVSNAVAAEIKDMLEEALEESKE